MLNLVNGPQTIGNGRGFWMAFLAVLAMALAYPIVRRLRTTSEISRIS